jgi:hypothetical protein
MWELQEKAGTSHTLAEEKQARLEILMTKNSAGTLTDRERGELQALAREAEEITLANARLLAQQQRRLEPASDDSGCAP